MKIKTYLTTLLVLLFATTSNAAESRYEAAYGWMLACAKVMFIVIALMIALILWERIRTLIKSKQKP